MKKKKNTKTKKFYKEIRFYLLMILYICMMAFLMQIWKIDLIPVKYFLPLCIVFVLFAIWMFWMQYSKKIMKINKLLGKILLVVFIFLCIGGNLYVYQTDHALSKMTIEPGDKEYDHISVVVKKENKAKTLDDVKNSTFAVPKKIDEVNTNAIVKEINKVLKTNIKTASYANTNAQAKALLEGKNETMILNEAYRSLLDDKYPSFGEDTKVIYTYKIPKKVKSITKKVDVSKEAYNIYISGIDTYGPISTKSRSDVNMIATINPNTHTILLTSIPRDYYIPQTCQGGQRDKLTHTGIFGINCTVESMSNFAGIALNYYVRVNFSSLESIVNAIGGINIYNQMTFRSGVDGTLIPGGNIHVNGSMALKFARERHAYADGDRQRGRNQMIVLEGIIKKAISPAIITGYSRIMETVGNNFQTNMAQKEMTSILKKQLDEGSKWQFEQQSVTGKGETAWTPANGFNAYVMVPDTTSMQVAISNIQAVMGGKAITKK